VLGQEIEQFLTVLITSVICQLRVAKHYVKRQQLLTHIDRPPLSSPGRMLV